MVDTGKVAFEITELSVVAPSAELERDQQEEMLVLGLSFLVVELCDDFVLFALGKQGWIVEAVVESGDGEV